MEAVLSRSFASQDPADLKAYRDHGGYQGLAAALDRAPQAVIDAVEKSGLRGCGGAGFPTGLKWRLRGADVPEPRYMVCNVDETEPGSFKDRALLYGAPHLLIEGMLIAAHALGVQHAIIFVRGEYAAGARILGAALQQVRAAGLLHRGDIDLRLDVHISLGRYICGEDSAILNAIEGLRPNPRKKPPHISQYGLWQQPTTVNNAETMAHIPGVLAHGPQWFGDRGLNGGAGGKLYTVCGPVKRPGCFELPMGTTAREILYEHAGGLIDGHQLRGFLPGGSSTPFMLPEHLDTPMHFDAVAKAGSRLGTGGFIILDTDTCPVKFLCGVARFFARESCGFCTPCREGLPVVQWLLERIERGDATPQDIEFLQHLGAEIAPNSFCALAPGALMPVLSGLHAFHDDFIAHVQHHRCPYRDGHR
ncbi:MAG: complex I 51 kDa subunit family protein [Acidiferrobacter sp.]